MKNLRSHLRIGSFNVNGFRNATEEVSQLIKAEELDILALQETKVPKSYSFPQGRTHEAASINSWRQGLAFSIDQHLKYQRIFDIVDDAGQALAIRVEDLTIVNLYIQPQANNQLARGLLDKIANQMKGRGLIIGDFNARSRSWCTVDNARGPALIKWAEHAEWNIYAPEEPTRYGLNRAGQIIGSVIDLALTHMGTIESITTAKGIWDGTSDHRAIVATIKSQKYTLKKRRRISTKRRMREDLLKRFIETIPTQAEEIIKRIREASNQVELDNAYIYMIRILLEPFTPKGKIPPLRARYFWTNELERQSKNRSKLYRRFTRSRDIRDYNRYHIANKRLHRQCRKAKCRSYNEYRRNFEKATAGDAAKQLSGLIKKKTRNTADATPRTTAGLQRKKFTHFVSMKFPPRAQDAPVQPQHFRLTSRMETLIAMAALQAPRGKAAGLDETFGELFGLIPEITTPMIIALWSIGL